MSNKLYFEDSEAASASASINKTLAEIEGLLEGDELPRSGRLRTKLRNTLVEAFDDVGKTWYKKGFNRGHRQAFSDALTNGKVPRKLKVDIRRKFTASSERQLVKLRSSIKSEAI